jgi:hypothetical protein
MSSAEPLRVPIQVASQRGVSWLNEQAATRRILLTRFGKVASVIDSADRIDAALARLEVAAREVTDNFCDRASNRTPTVDLETLCSRLGLDPVQIRRRAEEIAGRTS